MLKVGLGIDVHAFEKGRKLILGGIELDYEFGLKGHSDADVLTHSIMDSLLGAASLGDIGKHFPDTDKKYKNISSLILLEKIVWIIKKNGFKINNIDTVIIAQQPKIAPYIEEMKKKLSLIMKIDFDQISIKATTSEWLGFTGRKEGIICYSNCLLNKQ